VQITPAAEEQLQQLLKEQGEATGLRFFLRGFG
jgi:Fe-S cluster assembly iron-binding protein IscA